MEKKHFYIILGVVILCLFISFTIAKTGTFNINNSSKQPERLESSLRQIAEAHSAGKDVTEIALTQGIYTKNGKLRVIIELESEDIPLPKDINIEVEMRRGSLIQALIPIDKLNELAEAPGVKYIRAPKEPVTD